MTDLTGRVVACHFDTGQVDQLGTFTTNVAAKDAAITHASRWANDLGTSMTFDPAAATATLGTGDVLQYRTVSDNAPNWPVGAQTMFDCDEPEAPHRANTTYERTHISGGGPEMDGVVVDLLFAVRLRGTDMQVWCETRGTLSPRTARVLRAALVEAIDNAEERESF